jgi:uncharacterized membrane protein
VWTEYGSVIAMIALIASALWMGVPRRRTTLAVGGLAVLTLAAWIPEIVRGQHQVGVTKFDPVAATPSLTALRDVFVTLTFGENGGTSSPAGRWLVFAVMVGLCGAGYAILRRGWSQRDPRFRRAVRLLAVTALLTLIGYALAAPLGVHVFTQRYLTFLVPLAAGLAGAVLVSVQWRWAVPGAAVLLAALGVGNLVRRLGAQYEPDLTPISQIAERDHARTVLTNTPVVLYYLVSLRPIFDRPYNLGPGLASTCARPCLVVDDTRVPGGEPRRAPGTNSTVGPYLLTYQP